MISRFSKSLNESLFIILPFVAVFLIRVAQGDIVSLLELSDPAIASCIVFGQLAAKYESLKGYKGERRDNFNLFTGFLRFMTYISLILYIILLSIDNLSKVWFVLAYAVFIFSFLTHIIFSQLASEMQDKIRKQ